MPEHFGIVPRAARDVKVEITAEPLTMDAHGRAEDSTRAAELLREMGVGCIVTLGGDGTNRVVTRGCGDTPIVALSTGTNNAFPTMIDGTLGGVAAGLVAIDAPVADAIRPSKWIEFRLNEASVDRALVDLVVSRERFIAARAIWNPSQVTDLILAVAEPGSLGFSAIGAHLDPLERDDPSGLHVRLGDGDYVVRAPIAPGLVRDVPVRSWRRLEPGEPVELPNEHGVVAFDGEKEYELSPSDRIAAVLRTDGPRRVDVRVALAIAARQGFFRARAGAGAR